MVVGGILSLANSAYVGHVNLEVQLVTITLILAREGYAFHRQERNRIGWIWLYFECYVVSISWRKRYWMGTKESSQDDSKTLSWASGKMFSRLKKHIFNNVTWTPK